MRKDRFDKWRAGRCSEMLPMFALGIRRVNVGEGLSGCGRDQGMFEEEYDWQTASVTRMMGFLLS